MNITKLRRASATVQAYLKEAADPTLIQTGEVSSRTMNVYESAPPSVKATADNLLVVFGFQNMQQLYAESQKYRDGGYGKDNAPLWETKVIPAVIRAAIPVGINPVNLVAQMAVESGWGKKVPLYNGQNSFNYAGIKAAAARGVPGYENVTSTTASTREVFGGRNVIIKDGFAVFQNADDFAKCYVGYLTKSKSSYRYPGIANNPTLEPFVFGSILQRGGYATDPGYASFFARVADTVRRKFAM